ncbi:MAG: hypothetical protein ACE361_00905 [Aureliella sp.]
MRVRNMVRLLALACTLCPNVLSAQVIGISGDVPKSNAISQGSEQLTLQIMDRNNRGLPAGTIAKYQKKHLSIGYLVQWDIRDEAKALKLSERTSKLLAKTVETRRLEQIDALDKLAETLRKADVAKESAAKYRKEAGSVFYKSEHESEQALVAALEEVLLPKEYSRFVSLLIKNNLQSIGGSSLLCEYLELSPKQVAKFEKVRKAAEQLSDPKFDGRRIIDAMIAAESALDEKQTEVFWKATERMSEEQSLSEYFTGLSEKRKKELAKYYPVFAKLQSNS